MFHETFLFYLLQWLVMHVVNSEMLVCLFVCVRFVVCFATALVVTVISTDGAGTVTVEEEEGTFEWHFF